MYVVTLARKPLSEPTVVSNVLAHGAGALAIDAVRVSLGANDPQFRLSGRVPTHIEHVYRGGFGRAKPAHVGEPHMQSVRHNTRGRWPANLLLEHRPGCRDGTVCDPECPVADLDERLGTRAAGHFPATQNSNPGAHGKMGAGWTGNVAPERTTGEGGVTRFFKQIGGQTDG